MSPIVWDLGIEDPESIYIRKSSLQDYPRLSEEFLLLISFYNSKISNLSLIEPSFVVNLSAFEMKLSRICEYLLWSPNIFRFFHWLFWWGELKTWLVEFKYPCSSNSKESLIFLRSAWNFMFENVSFISCSMEKYSWFKENLECSILAKSKRSFMRFRFIWMEKSEFWTCVWICWTRPFSFYDIFFIFWHRQLWF